MKRTIAALFLSALCLCASGRGQTRQLVEKLSQQEPLKTGVWGMLAVTVDGDTLVNVNSCRRMVPASNMKVITTGLALNVLGPDYRFKTTLGYDGEVVDGTLVGDLYIVGGADPTIGAGRGCVANADPYAEWRKLIQDAGIRKIQGRIVGDSRFFDGDSINGCWNVDDIIDGDGVGVEGLNIYRDTLYLQSGAYLCAQAFNMSLIGSGLNVPRDSVSDRAVCDSLTIIGSAYSPELKYIVEDCNHNSDNFYAETLLRMVGKTLSGSASYDSSVDAVKKQLSSMGLGSKLKTIQIIDGSGLARKNYQTPDFLVSFLSAMTRSRNYQTYLDTLPQAGKGTLKSRLLNAPEADRKRVCMKSGSMNGIRCYSGYILPKDGVKSHTIVFSFMSNNAVVSQSILSKLTDQIIACLATEN